MNIIKPVQASPFENSTRAIQCSPEYDPRREIPNKDSNFQNEK